MTRLRIDRGSLLFAIEDHSFAHAHYLDLRTGEIRLAVDETVVGEDQGGREVLEDEERFLPIDPLPGWRGFEIMESFVRELEAGTARSRLARALRGGRPFRRFRDALLDFPEVREQWFRFHDRSLEAAARQWLSDEGLDADLVEPTRGSPDEEAPGSEGEPLRGRKPRRAVVLLSGGLDSATCLAIARAEGFECYALSFSYGQRHSRELEAARRVAEALGVAAHRVAEVDLRAFGGSALTDDIDVPKADSAEGIGAEIPVTYVPARNTIFLSYALAWGEVLGARDLFVGVNALDYSGYPDCRPEFLEAFERVANLGTKAGVEGSRFRVRAPLLRLTKAQIIRRGMDLGLDYGLTRSCYDPDPAGRACGRCDSCLLRKRGFAEAGVPDPTEYVDLP